MTRLLLIGPPGAGKGTQAERLSKTFAVPAVSTGDIFRSNIKDKTPLGLRVKAFIDQGTYVPDNLTNKIVQARLQAPDANGGFILDGYPRTAEQVIELDRLLAADGTHLDVVVQLVADTNKIITRLLKRAHSQDRTDDTEEIIRRRIELYESQTAPLLSIYNERRLVERIDGVGSVDEVTDRVVAALKGRGITPVTVLPLA
jgi:adenylate kinase